MLDAALDGKVIERPDVAQPHQLGALDGTPRLTERRVTPDETGGKVVHGACLCAFGVVELRVDGHRHVGRQGPWRRRPDEQAVISSIQERKSDRDRLVRELGIGIEHLVLRDRGSTPRTPRHRTMPPVQPAAPVAVLQRVPVVFDVDVRHREIGAWPVHPLAEPPGLLRLDFGEVQDPISAGEREALETERLDLALRVEPEGFLDFDFHPQALAVKAVLESLFVAGQGFVALDDVFICTSPCVMDTHGVVRRDRTIEEGEARPTAVLGNETRKDLLSLPELQRGAGDGDEVKWPRHRKHARLRWFVGMTRFRRPFASRGSTRCRNETAARRPDGRGIRESAT